MEWGGREAGREKRISGTRVCGMGDLGLVPALSQVSESPPAKYFPAFYMF